MAEKYQQNLLGFRTGNNAKIRLMVGVRTNPIK